jgi:peptide/nickel transport system permease protein
MRRINIPLILGTLLIVILLVIALFPSLFTDRNPYAMSLLQTWVDDEGGLQFLAAPFEPGDRYALGSDKVGRDIWSLVIIGTRLTLSLALAVTLLRFLIAIPMGVAGAMGSRTSKGIIDQFNIVLTTIPPLLIGILILKMAFFTSLYKFQSAIVFILTLTVIGWARMGNLMFESSSKIMEETFILSEKAIGKSKLSIAVKNVFPHLLPELVVMFFMEIARVLTLMMQLGIFGVFVGNVRIVKDSGWFGYSYINLPYEPEWSGLMGAAKEYVRGAPWIVFTAAAFFVVSVLAFNLFGEGLRIELQKKNSKVINFIRGVFHRSPKSSKEIRLTYGVLGLTIVVIFGTAAYSQFNDRIELSEYHQIGYNYENIIIGSEQSVALGDLIGEAMEEMGIEPLRGEYHQYFDEIDNLYFSNSEMAISDGKYAQMLRFGEDVEIIAGHTGRQDLEVIDLTEDFYDFSGTDIEGKMIYVDSEIISHKAVLNSVEHLVENGAEGVITTHDEVDYIVSENKPYYYIVVNQSFKDYFKSEKVLLSLDMSSETYNHDASNVIGIIEGNDEVVSDKGIIIAMDYSFINRKDNYEIINAYLRLVKTIKDHDDQLKNSVVFAFFADREKAIEYYAQHQLFQTKNILVYHDLMGLDQMEFSDILFSDKLSPVSRYYGFTLSYQIKDKMGHYLSEETLVLDPIKSYLYDKKGYTTLLYEANGEHGMDMEEFLGEFAQLIIENAR